MVFGTTPTSITRAYSRSEKSLTLVVVVVVVVLLSSTAGSSSVHYPNVTSQLHEPRNYVRYCKIPERIRILFPRD